VLSVQALIDLSTDHDDDVRDWATFALGSLCQVDTAQVREALFARVSDEDADVRGEALVGLATRGDRRATPHICAELKRGSTEYLILEAAEEMLTACPDEDELRQLFTARAGYARC
jgi:HEAT repeat protein